MRCQSPFLSLSIRGIYKFNVFTGASRHHTQSRLWLTLDLHRGNRLDVLSRYLGSYFQKAQALLICIHSAREVLSCLYSICSSLHQKLPLNVIVTASPVRYRTFLTSRFIIYQWSFWTERPIVANYYLIITYGQRIGFKYFWLSLQHNSLTGMLASPLRTR